MKSFVSLLVFSTFNIYFVCVVQRFFVSVQLVESWAQFVFQHDQRQIDLQLSVFSVISASWENDSQKMFWHELIYAEIFWHQWDFSHF